jgi:hypothetical protein
MSALLSTPNNTNISTLSRKAVPGSRNPFLTPTGQLRDSPPHLTLPFPREQTTRQPQNQMQLIPKSLSSSSSDEEQSLPHRSRRIAHTSRFNEVFDHNGTMFLDPNDDQDVIKEKTMAGVPTWPSNLCLSLNANNWLEWSCEILNNLKMAQLNIYPLSLLSCPDSCLDHASHHNWRGNNQMVLRYMNSHMYLAECQCIAECPTSVEAYKTLRRHHEKRSRLTQTVTVGRP